SPLEPVTGAAQLKPKCERFWTLPLDVPAQLRADMACHELVELGADVLPGEWPGRKSGIIRYLVAEGLTALEPDCHPARKLAGVAGREAFVWPYADLKEQALDIRLRNALGVELLTYEQEKT